MVAFRIGAGLPEETEEAGGARLLVEAEFGSGKSGEKGVSEGSTSRKLPDSASPITPCELASRGALT